MKEWLIYSNLSDWTADRDRIDVLMGFPKGITEHYQNEPAANNDNTKFALFIRNPENQSSGELNVYALLTQAQKDSLQELDPTFDYLNQE